MEQPVYNTCLEIIDDKKKLNHSQLDSKWTIFQKKYPQLYLILTMTEHVDIKMLKFLCDKADEQTKSKVDNLEIDFEVGDKLAEKFIYDKFNEPSTQQKEFIKETLRNKILKD